MRQEPDGVDQWLAAHPLRHDVLCVHVTGADVQLTWQMTGDDVAEMPRGAWYAVLERLEAMGWRRSLCGDRLHPPKRTETNEQTQPKGRQGFASMSPERRREIARKGGKVAHAMGKAHVFTPQEAREAGKKGGLATQAKGAGHRWTIEEAQEAGRRGGKATKAKAASGETVVEGTVEVVTPAISPRITSATYVTDDGSRLTITPKSVRATGKAAADLVRCLGGGGGEVRR